MTFFFRVAGPSLRDMARHPEGVQSRVIQGGSGISLGGPLDFFLWGSAGRWQVRGYQTIDPELAGRIIYPMWPGNTYIQYLS